MDNAELVKTTLDAMERLLRMFMLERFIYLALTLLSFCLLLYAIVQLFAENQMTTTLLVSIFGGSGLIAVSSMRVVWFFNRAFSLIEGQINKLAK
ncbi:hypothetical protein [Arsukibacterium sp.]|uniref:hypothetical protein n=1 Tax=Arsukibacterium sp. TaxID=1977258 RepID=UPI00356B0A38